MTKKLIRTKYIVSADKDNNIFSDYCIEITGDRITGLFPFKAEKIANYDGVFIDLSDRILIPGFVQTHIHLCQTLFRGLADDLQLLDWLQLRIFPYENSHNKDSLKLSARLGINELLKSGTTTLLDMGTLRYQEVIFEELAKSGMRAIAGKCMIDFNELFPNFVADTKDELSYTYELAKTFHNCCDGRIKYGFAPRFVLSCSETLLKETKSMMEEFPGSIYHTHSSENKEEVKLVKKLYRKENIEYFDSINVLDDHTVLAHCIHLNDNEVKTLKRNNVRVSHCPSSNLKLGSGIADIPRYIKEGISVSLGADGAPCNNNLSVFYEMRLASLIQKPIYNPTEMDAKTIFRLATIEGAKALHLDNEIGSIEVGKKADIVFLDLNKTNVCLLDDKELIYSKIVYSCNDSCVDSVMVDGEWVVKNGTSLLFDEEKLSKDGKSELKKLIKRAEQI